MALGIVFHIVFPPSSWDLGPSQYLFGDNSAFNQFNQPNQDTRTVLTAKPFAVSRGQIKGWGWRGVGKDGVGISTAVGSSLYALTLRTSWQDNAAIVSSSRSGESSLARDPERPSLYC